MLRERDGMCYRIIVCYMILLDICHTIYQEGAVMDFNSTAQPSDQVYCYHDYCHMCICIYVCVFI